MKPPYAESTLRRKYRDTGIENIGQVQEYLTACSNFYYIIEMEDVWKVIGGKCGVIREEFDSLLPIMARDDSLAFYIAPENEFYHDGTDDLLLINKVYLCVDDEEEGLVEDWDRFFAIDSQRRGKPLCIPADLLAYADDDYYENTPQAQAMLRFLEQRRPAKEEQETKRKIAECTLVRFCLCVQQISSGWNPGGQFYFDGAGIISGRGGGDGKRESNLFFAAQCATFK